MTNEEEKRGGRAPGTKKTGGRTKGTPNKITKQLRECITSFLEDNFDEAVAAWSNIKKPESKLKLYIELINYAVPKLQSVEFEGKLKKDDDVEKDLIELSDDEKTD